MRPIGFVMCPNYKCSIDGSVCEVTNAFISNMKDVSLEFCMSRHHEACSVYIRSLYNMIDFGSYSVSLRSLEH